MTLVSIAESIRADTPEKLRAPARVINAHCMLGFWMERRGIRSNQDSQRANPGINRTFTWLYGSQGKKSWRKGVTDQLDIADGLTEYLAKCK